MIKTKKFNRNLIKKGRTPHGYVEFSVSDHHSIILNKSNVQNVWPINNLAESKIQLQIPNGTPINDIRISKSIDRHIVVVVGQRALRSVDGEVFRFPILVIHFRYTLDVK